MSNLRNTLLTITITWGWASSSSSALAQVNTKVHVSACKVSQLSAAEDRNDSDGMAVGLGHEAITIAIRNHSLSPCSLRGIPVVVFPGSVPVCPNCADYLFSPQPVKEIILTPDMPAYVIVAYDIDDGAGPCRNADTLRMYLPRDRDPLKVYVAQGPNKLRSCGHVDVTPFLGTPPVQGHLPGPAEN